MFRLQVADVSVPSAGQDDPHVAVQSRLERSMQSAFRYAPDIGLRNRDRDDLIVAIQEFAVNVSPDSEALKHAARVVVGTPTDIGDDAKLWFHAERASAGVRGGPRIETAVVVHDFLDFAPRLGKVLRSRCQHCESLNLEGSDCGGEALSTERRVGIDDESDNCGSHALN
ncbi:hypothetical protein [Microbacterium sp. P5_E9]